MRTTDWNDSDDVPLHRSIRRAPIRSTRMNDSIVQMEDHLGKPLFGWLMLAAAIVFDEEWEDYNNTAHRAMQAWDTRA